MLSGLGAAIDGIHCLERWKIAPSAADNAIACSDSYGAVLQSAANKDWQGVAVGFGHTPPKLPGEVFQFVGMAYNGDGWQSSASGAIVDRVRIFCQSQQSKIFFYHLYFSATGSLARGSYTLPDLVTPNPAGTSERGVKIDGSSISGVSDWELELVCANSEPMWPAEDLGWPRRTVGNKDATITWRQYPPSVSGLPDLNDVSVFNLMVTASLSWEIKWGKVLELPTEYVIRDEENRPKYVQTEGVARFSSVVSGASGWIKTPAGAYFWKPYE